MGGWKKSGFYNRPRHPSGAVLRGFALAFKLHQNGTCSPLVRIENMSDAPSSTNIPARLEGVENGLKAVVSALGLMLTTLHQQTNLLQELADAAREPPGESPVVKSLDQLTEAVLGIGAGVQSLTQKVDGLPAALAQEQGSVTDEAAE
jgi:hypothetical protein